MITTDLSTKIGKVRFEIGDDNDAEITPDAGVLPSGNNYSDGQIEKFLSDAAGSVTGAAILAAENLATRWAAAAEKVKIRDYSIDTTGKVADYQDLAARLKQRRESSEDSAASSGLRSGSLSIERWDY